MKNFDDFWKFLETSNPAWYEWNILTVHRDKDPKACAKECWGYLLSDTVTFEKMKADPPAMRKYFVSWLIKAPRVPQAPQLQQVEEPKVETDPTKLPIPKDDPRYQEYLQKWLAEVDKFAVNHPVPKVSKKEAAEEGDWLPKKQARYNPPPAYITLVNENIKKFAAKKYKGLRYIDGFKRFGFGEVSVLAENEQDAKEIIKKAERLAKLQIIKLSNYENRNNRNL